MMMNDTFIVSKAGYKHIAAAVAFFIIFALFGWGLFKFLSFAALIFFIFIYRNPERETPYFQTGSLVSPVDGKITAINTLDNGYEIVIKSSLLDTSILRVPFLSKVKSFHIRKGARLSTDIRKAMFLNEKFEVSFEDKDGHIMHIQHLLDNSIDDITANLHLDQEFNQGKRYGVMTKGKTIITLPMTCRLSLHVGEKVRAGETLLGYIT
ncbi:phosphatidylserine decarboxylase [Sulfurimonas sp. HSL-1716]|uniref:phosphatidylserine decarboxylase n=1 Tax=Hydrocurvibacter sulfurireducens TaxID=3131937 RepID=UPI0031F9BABA